MNWNREDITFSDMFNFAGEKILNFWQKIAEFFRKLFGGK